MKLLTTEWEMKEFFEQNPNTWENSYILAEHTAKIVMMEPGTTINLMSFEITREKSSSPEFLNDRQWDQFWIRLRGDHNWNWCGNLWGIIKTYTVNYLHNHRK